MNENQNTTQTKEEVVEKIKKLFALSNRNDNEAESKKAMLMAQKLLAKHGLSMEEIGDTNIVENIIEQSVGNQSKFSFFEKVLFATIGDNFRVKPVIQSSFTNKRLLYIGRETDVTVASEVFKYAKKQADYHAKQFIKKSKENGTYIPRTTKTSYLQGFARGVKISFEEQKKALIEENNKFALVLQGVPKDVTEYLSKEMPDLKSTAIRTSADTDYRAYNNGREQGKKFKRVHGEIE